MGHQDPTWRTLVDHEGHEVNSQGQVRNIKTGKILRMSVNQTNVRYVTLRNTNIGQYENKAVSALIAEAFCPGRTREASTVMHLDGDTLNNAPNNLMWAERWHAMAYHREVDMLRRRTARSRKIQIQDQNGRIYTSYLEAAMATGCLPSSIEYAVDYNANLEQGSHTNFVHKTFPGGFVFRTV